MDSPPAPQTPAPPSSPQGWHRAWPVLVIAVGVGLAATLLLTSPEPQRRSEPPRRIDVEVAEVGSTSHRVVLRSQGTVRARMAGPLGTQVAGQVVEVTPAFTDGALVEEGEVLIRLESRDYALTAEELEGAQAIARAELAEITVQLENLEGQRRLVEEQLELRRRQLERAQGLRGGGVTTEDDLLAAQVAELGARQTKLNLEDQRRSLLARQGSLRGASHVSARRLARAKLDLQRTEIRAPYAARVVRRTVSVGEFVPRGATLGELYAVGELEVRLPLTSQQLLLLELPQPGEAGPSVTFTARSGQGTLTWRGRVVGAEGRVDVTSRQLAVIARLDPNPLEGGSPELRPGSYVSAELEGRLLNGVYVIPRAAALGGTEVLVADSASGVVHRRAISVVRKTVDHLIVGDGLHDGELLCTTPLVFAGDTLKVEIRRPKAAQ